MEDILMEQKKYWRNIIKGPFWKELEPGMSGTSIWAHHDEYRNGTTLGYHCITSTYEAMFPHSHPFHELLCFLGGNPEDINDLGGAEVTVCLGEEKEEYKFTTAGVISIPPGLLHCPLTVRNVTKPIVFLEISTTSGYTSSIDNMMRDGALNPSEKTKKKA
jgi:hypothetical protein